MTTYIPNEDHGSILQLTIRNRCGHALKDLDLDSWFEEWLIEDYEVMIDCIYFYSSSSGSDLFTVDVPVKYIKPSNLYAAMNKDSYPQTDKGYEFHVISKAVFAAVAWEDKL